MKKILLAFDGSHFSKGAFEFARILNESERILLTGVFLPQVDYANLWSYSGGGISGNTFIPLLEDEDAEAVAQNIDKFESLCRKNGIEYRTHDDFSEFALPGLRKESRFADLLIVGSESFYENFGTGEPNDYLKDTLHEVECPVIVVPENFDVPKSTILLYDGSDASVYAIKQFTYLFPELLKNKAMLVYINNHEEIPEQVNIEELTARHFPDLTIMKLEFDPAKYLTTWLTDKKPGILVSGSFSRSAFSRMLKKSFVSEVIREHTLPVFIAHK
ncbi:MAG: universal stress protein [Bacteroidota bacterium]